MIEVPNITEIDLKNKRILIREDFNVSILQDRIINDRRIQASLPTIEYALEKGAAIILLSHRGNPTPTSVASDFSLKPIAYYLSNYLKQTVRFEKDWIQGIEIKPGEVVLCENVRLQPGETTNDPFLAKRIAALADIFVMDAFAVAHRTAASTVGIIENAKKVCTGLLLNSELENLIPLENPEYPFVALVGGAKNTTKLKALESLLQKVDHLLLGGDLANAFLKIKSSLDKPFLQPEKQEALDYILTLIKKYSDRIYLPQDGIVKTVDNNGRTHAILKSINDMSQNEKISDIGPLTISHYTQILETAKTLFWNGPMGIFEELSFQSGTKTIAQTISYSSAFSVAGGGETLAAIDKWQAYPTCISTGGGALLYHVAGKPLPAIQALQNWVSQ